jgi:subtilisin-like proprotein convertase family protein
VQQLSHGNGNICYLNGQDEVMTMKRVTILLMLTLSGYFLLGTDAFAQRTRTLRFDVRAGGRVPEQAGQTRSGDNPLDDAQWTVFTFTVTGFRPGEKIIDVNINIDMVHTWVEDLEIRLRAPRHDGLLFEIVLFNQHPGNNPTRFDDFDNTYFTDQAAQSIEDGSAPYNGDFRPLQPLRQFNGLNPNGTWELRIFDHFYGDYGWLYKNGDPRFERRRGPWIEGERIGEWHDDNPFPFMGGTWLEITVPEPASWLALLPPLAWLMRRRRR